MSSGSLLDDDHWHSVVIQRVRRNVNFTLDHHTQPFRTNGEFDHLDLDFEVCTDAVAMSVLLHFPTIDSWKWIFFLSRLKDAPFFDQQFAIVF